ncbi:MAG TPA: helix-turn-helix transcriptional regulator [Actinophytocola sp.]|nr:helix-turn-helix transcriptional regulator [Actinophytocola sp.]
MFHAQTVARCHQGAQTTVYFSAPLANADTLLMARRPGVPVRQRRVSTELRELRKKAGLTCSDVAKALGTSTTKISRMETGERGLYADDVAALLGLYRVPTKHREELLHLVRNGGDPNWWQLKPSDLPTEWRDLMALEADATTILNFEPLLVPGLLQTEEYTSTIISGINPELPESDLNALVATRMGRKSLLSKRNAPTLHAIIDEMVLRRPIGEPGVMERQLQHLAASAQRPNITLRVVPFLAGATPALSGPFVILDLVDGRSVVHLEARRTAAFLSEESHVRAAKLAMRRLNAVALAPDESAQLIATILGEQTHPRSTQ